MRLNEYESLSGVFVITVEVETSSGDVSGDESEDSAFWADVTFLFLKLKHLNMLNHAGILIPIE